MKTPRCLACGYLFDSSAPLTGKPVQPGHASICARCGAVSFYTDEMQVREPTSAELRSLAMSLEVVTAQKHVRMAYGSSGIGAALRSLGAPR